MSNLLFHCTSNKSIILKDGIRETKKVSINGTTTYIRTGGTVNYYVLCVIDAEGNTVDPSKRTKRFLALLQTWILHALTVRQENLMVCTL